MPLLQKSAPASGHEAGLLVHDDIPHGEVLVLEVVYRVTSSIMSKNLAPFELEAVHLHILIEAFHKTAPDYSDDFLQTLHREP